MKHEFKRQIVELLDQHRIMTVATNRADGWPQATVVGYANDGLIIYCLVARDSQKFANITRDPRVSIAIANDYPQPLQIRVKLITSQTFSCADIPNTRSCRGPTRPPCQCCGLRRRSSRSSTIPRASAIPTWCGLPATTSPNTSNHGVIIGPDTKLLDPVQPS